MAIVKDKAFALRSYDFQETSRIVSLYTNTRGKIRGLCKGIRAGKKNFTTMFDIGTLNEVVFYESHNELWLISYGDLINADAGRFYGDMEKHAMLHYIMELVDRIMPLHVPASEVFSLIERTISCMQERPAAYMVYIFQAKLLEISGFRPSLHVCVRCGTAIRAGAFFSMRMGGLLCDRCRRADLEARTVSADVITSLQYIQHHDLNMALRLKPSLYAQREMCRLLDEFLGYHVNARMRSLDSLCM